VTTILNPADDVVVPDSTKARIAVWASFVGLSLEAYDFYVFAYFSATFSAQLFFPKPDRIVGTISAPLVLASSLFVRPLGAIIFDLLEDRVGRKRTLLLTISIMGVATRLSLHALSSVRRSAPSSLARSSFCSRRYPNCPWGKGCPLSVCRQ